MKKLLILLTLSITILSGCAQITKNSDVEVSPNESTPSESITLTLEELAQYNGQDSQLAYVAVNGIIYDVSAIPQWLNGMHKNGL
ncbi:MAG: cytochrome b5 domain-containing protein, partial [Culicoidibacterales bacterium]